MKNVCEISGVKYQIEKVAPDGGWGILIGIGLAVPIGCIYGGLYSFGLLYNDFLKSVGAETGMLSIMIGTFFGALSVASLLSNALLHQFTMRSVGLFGAFCFFIGSIMSIFVTTVGQLIISYGVLQGVGAGLMSNVAYGTFNYYFVKRRIFAMSLVQILKGMILVGHPILVGFFMNTYGFRGTAAIVAAINGNCIFAMFVMHPVEWHYKEIKIRVIENEMHPLMNTKIDVADTQNDPIKIKINHTPQIEEKSKPCTIIEKIVHFLDLKLLNDAIYVNIVFGLTFALFSDSMFSTLLPVYMMDKGFSKSDVAITLAIGRGADMVARLMLAILSLIIPMKARNIAFFGVASLIFIRYAFLYAESILAIKIIVSIQNMLTTCMMVSLPLTFAEHLSKERFPSGYGLFLFLNGICIFVLSPIVGWIRDITQSYVIYFHSLSIVLSLCAIPWAIEFIWLRIRSQRK